MRPLLRTVDQRELTQFVAELRHQLRVHRDHLIVRERFPGGAPVDVAVQNVLNLT